MTPIATPASNSVGPRMSLSSLLLVVLTCMLVLAFVQSAYWYFTVDDAFITFRYAENLAHGHGVVYNPGERVEGYTNFLWMLVMSLMHVVGADTVIAAKLLGAALGLALVPLTAFLVVRTAGRATPAAGLASVLLAISPSVAVWSVAGMETTLFAALATFGVWALMTERDNATRFPWSSVLFVLAAMTRPEGVLFFVVSAVFVFRDWRRGRTPTSRFALWLVVFVAIGAAYMAWRWSYFGYALPNTFYAKTGRGIYQWLGGVLYTTAGIRKHGGMLLFAMALIPAFWGTCRGEKTRYLATLLAVWLAYNIYKGHDVLSMFRFFVPMLPIVFALASLALVDLFAIARSSGLSRRSGVLITVLFIGGTLAINGVLAYVSRDLRAQTREYQLQLRMDARWFMPTIQRLREIAPKTATIALIDAGAIAYYTGWYVIDRWGLCDEHIAHSEVRGPLGEKFDPDYVLDKKPTFIQTKVTRAMEESGDLRGAWAGDVALFAHPRFLGEYRRLEGAALGEYFVRKDVELTAPELRQD